MGKLGPILWGVARCRSIVPSLSHRCQWLQTRTGAPDWSRSNSSKGHIKPFIPNPPTADNGPAVHDGGYLRPQNRDGLYPTSVPRALQGKYPDCRAGAIWRLFRQRALAPNRNPVRLLSVLGRSHWAQRAPPGKHHEPRQYAGQHWGSDYALERIRKDAAARSPPGFGLV